MFTHLHSIYHICMHNLLKRMLVGCFYGTFFICSGLGMKEKPAGKLAVLLLVQSTFKKKYFFRYITADHTLIGKR